MRSRSVGACTTSMTQALRSDVKRDSRDPKTRGKTSLDMMIVAFNHEHMTVMHMESTLPVFKSNGSEMVTESVLAGAIRHVLSISRRYPDVFPRSR